MATTAAKKLPVRVARETIPPLENGDHLTAAEFERRYDAMPDLRKAELIEGVVYVASPVRHRDHGRPHALLSGWLLYYEAGTFGVQVGAESSLRLDDENEPQPDGLLFIEPEYGGQVQIDDAGYVVGGPELVGEVSASSASLDLHAKLAVYHRHKVKEYIVWRVLDNRVDWFVRRRGQFTRLRRGRDGLSKSQVFPGLWLDADALVQRDSAAVLKALDRGLASPEHAAFVARLRNAD